MSPRAFWRKVLRDRVLPAIGLLAIGDSEPLEGPAVEGRDLPTEGRVL